MIRRILISICLLILYSIQAVSQLQANFTIDKSAGCSPLDVRFTNTTTGASDSVNYKWNLGNGNSSALPSPGATYSTPKSYTVTLTATDKGVKSSVSKTVLIYQKPTVNFSALPLKGCTPLNVSFTSAITPGDGIISNYLWDFGDGKTAQGNKLDTISHTYTVPQKPPISLTVTNSFGCYATADKNNLVDVLKPIIADFTPSQLALCTAGDIQFTNKSTGGGTFSYSWNFGDGQTSSAKSPKHSFLSPGTFLVKLTVRNDAGCIAAAKPVSINVANIKANFTLPVITCTSRNISFLNASTKNYDSLRWTINGVSAPYVPASGSLIYNFTTPGYYDIKLVAYYKDCTDSVTKKVSIGTVPDLNGFLVLNVSSCGLPATFTFTDTTKDAVKWQWKYLGNTATDDSTQTASHTFTEGSSVRINLTVTNKERCSKSIGKLANIDTADIDILIKKSSSGVIAPNRGCPGLNITFGTSAPGTVASFAWNFGDGSSASIAAPSHIYNTPGSYQVTLNYVTKNGCKGLATFDSIYINDIQHSDFSVAPSQIICGNSKVVFTPTLSMPNRDYIWLINGTQASYSLTPSPFTHRFDSAGIYTISLVIRAGTCTDTLTKIDYVTVLPPFPQVQSAVNTCDGTRGLVVFTDTTRQAKSWNWNFGDGNNTLDYNNFQQKVNHVYTQSGKYKVKLTVTNGNCTVADSLEVNVLLKQKPLLLSESTLICTSDSPFIRLSNFELNPAAGSSQPYTISNLQFGDLTNSKATINIGSWSSSFRAALYRLESGKEDIRIITKSYFFACEDTSNFAKLKIAGPTAAFNFNAFECFKTPLTLRDKSIAASGTPIVKWEWLFGDSTGKAVVNGDDISHQYKQPGNYKLSLRVTDAGGCIHQTPPDSVHTITLTGPMAAFTASAYNVPVNTTVNFLNTSLYFKNSELIWHFSDGSVSTNNNASFLFDKEGDFKVMLTTNNLLSNCRDTAESIIYVRKFQSLFTYNITYTDINNCPPVIVNLKTQSINATRVRWVFGDGGEAGNQPQVEHVYTNPGLYQIIHYSYDSVGHVDSAIQSLEVKGPHATITADTLQVKFTADTINATSFKWDFGDGTIATTKDTFATHLYITPGVYIPGLILTDPGGCNATSQFDKKIILDSLSIDFSPSPNRIICDSALVSFTPVVYSLSEEKLFAPLQYLWTSTMHPTQPINKENASWYFDKKGVHDIKFQVSSAYGCKADVTKQVVVKPGVTASINVAGVACRYDSILFKGTAKPSAAGMQWHWQLGTSKISDLQNPSVIYSSPGQQLVSLVVNNGFCQDSAYYALDVLNKPVVSVSASKSYLCEGDSIELTAVGGIKSVWTPTVHSLRNNGLNVVVQPVVTTYYTATISDSAGCSTKDSILMKVANPFSIKAVSPIIACPDYNVRLSASGADHYQWTGNGLTTTTADPYVIAVAPAVYKVVGYDSYNCFTDTAEVALQIAALPEIEAGPDQKIIAGQEVKLISTSGTDVVKWNWQPATYLNCTNCASPVCKPLATTDYVLTVTNNAGCMAKDSVRVEMICGGDLIYVPTGFTPNGDNLNDRFNVHGSGIRIKRLAVFNRWGIPVFERKDISPYDRNSGWDGMYKGQLQPAGSYVYMLEAVCEKGEAFTFKGTFTLIR
jgi:gliding motility-associated-like protein